jgi:hypothetical protein
MYAIERNVPYIDKYARQWAHGNTKYPFPRMKVGESFFAPVEDTGTIPRIRAAASMYGSNNNMKFRTRIVDGGLRVWRIA